MKDYLLLSSLLSADTWLLGVVVGVSLRDVTPSKGSGDEETASGYSRILLK